MIWHYSETFNSLDSFTTYCPNIHFNILLPSLTQSSKWMFSKKCKGSVIDLYTGY